MRLFLCCRLSKARSCLEAELVAPRSSLLRHSGGGEEGEAMRTFVQELMELEATLAAERKAFERTVVAPVCSLRRELQEWAGHPREEALNARREAILRRLEEVKQEHQRVQLRLQAEADSLYGDINQCFHGNCIHGDKDQGLVSRGVPPEVLALDCPDAALKEQLMQEFRLLDSQCGALLDQWQWQNGETLRQAPHTHTPAPEETRQ